MPPHLSTPGRWQAVGTRHIYENRWVTLREDQVIRPDGSRGIYSVLSFPELALGIVPVTPKGDTVLVGQHRYTLGTWSWEIPEGGGNPMCPLVEEAGRELREETGLVASRWTDLGPVEPSNSATDQRGRAFLAEDLTETELQPDPTEFLVLWRLPLKEALAMALDGRISDALSVVGLTRAAHRLGLARSTT
jgi:8-oxo-dGTP pyrophosphatase MutT (NUDIX family)